MLIFEIKSGIFEIKSAIQKSNRYIFEIKL